MLNHGVFHTRKEIFTPEECKQLIEDTEKKYKYLVAGVGVDEDKVIPGVRNSHIIWLKDKSLYNKISSAVIDINKKDYEYKLTYLEPIQFTRYLRQHHYDWHNDGIKARDMSPKRKNLVRKISCTILLNDDYTEGDLVLQDPLEPGLCENSIDLRPGEMLAFPSYIMHKVNPVATGKRYALVAWFNGPPWA